MIIGLDQGYDSTKTRNLIFKSRVRRGTVMDLNKLIEDTDDNERAKRIKNIPVTIGGIEYVVGETGDSPIDMNKIETETARICTLTALALTAHSLETTFDVVAGLPIEFYEHQKEQLKETLLGYGSQEIKIDGFKKKIAIRRVEVFPQAAGSVFVNPEKYQNSNTLIIDWGGNTVDVAWFEGLNLVKYSSYPAGMMHLYTKLIKILNTKNSLSLKPFQAEGVLRNGLTLFGKKQDIKYLDLDIQAHVDEVATTIKTEYPTQIMDYIELIGGGCNTVYEPLKRNFINIEPQDRPQTANAEYFEAIGNMRWMV